MRKVLTLAIAALVLAPCNLTGQTPADSAAIVGTALDYIEGWYEGDVERMERALHPELAKRMVSTDLTTGKSTLNDMGAEQLVAATRAGYGTRTPEGQRQRDLTILDVFENTASVKIVARDWIDYMHVVKFDGHWVIINVLWELKPEAAQRLR